MKRLIINIPELLELTKSKRISYDIMKQVCYSAGISLAELVRRRNALHPDDKTTPQNLSNKLSRDSLKLSEFLELVDCAGFRLVFEEVEPAEGLVDLQGNPLTPKSTETNLDKSKTFSELLMDGYCEVKSTNFKSAIVAGAKCEEAAKWIEENINNFDYDETQEIMLYIAAARQFKVKVKPISADANTEFNMI